MSSYSQLRMVQTSYPIDTDEIERGHTKIMNDIDKYEKGKRKRDAKKAAKKAPAKKSAAKKTAKR